MDVIINVKPNAPETKIVEKGKEWRVAVKAPPDKGKANAELVKFLTKELKKKVTIKSGHASRKKVLRIE